MLERIASVRPTRLEAGPQDEVDPDWLDQLESLGYLLPEEAP